VVNREIQSSRMGEGVTMADLKISALTASTTVPVATDAFVTVEAMGGTPATKRKAWSVLKGGLAMGLGARAHLSATLGTTVSAVETLVHLDHEDYDVGSDFDAATSHLYTVPVAGYYLVIGCVSFNNFVDGNPGSGILYYDGVWTIMGSHRIGAGGGETEYVSDIRHFTAGQTIGLYYYHEGPTTTDVTQDETFLIVTLLTAD
jgi:hypothetical protein